METTHRRLVPSRLASVAAIAVALGVATTTPASANQPGKESFSGDVSSVSGPELCDFPISVTTHYRGFEIDFASAVHQQVTQQDSFSANGHTLTGMPYTAEVDLRFDDSGDLVSQTAQGVVERVRLPDGRLFLAAGRVDLSTASGGILVVPDVGTSPDVPSFCAALAP